MHSTRPKIYKWKLIELKWERDKPTFREGNLNNNFVSPLDRNRKFSKDSKDLNNSIMEHDYINTHRTLHPMTIEFIFSLAHRIFAKTKWCGIKQVSKTSQKTKIIQSIVSLQ